MALSANKGRTYFKGTNEMPIDSLPVQASTTIYAGGALSMDSGGEVGPIATGETFVGFALAKVSNASGSAGDVNARVNAVGDIELIVTGVNDNDDIGDTVYATDDDTFTLTSSGAVSIGKVTQVIDLTTGKCTVHFEGAQRRSI